jgi:hypothetical protein
MGKTPPGELCLQGSLSVVSLIVTCSGRPRIGDPVQPEELSPCHYDFVIDVLALFSYNTVQESQYCFSQKNLIRGENHELRRSNSSNGA